VVASSFRMFTATADGKGQALAFNVSAADGSTSLNKLSQPAQSGQNVILNGTGLGAISSDETQSGVMDVPASTPVVYVGGAQATVVSAGRGTCCSGVDPSFPILQGIAAWDTITFTVPAGLQGCAVPVVVQLGASVSNFGTMSIAAADGTCYDASSANGAYIQNLLTLTGIVKTGAVTFTRLGLKATVSGGISIATTNDSGSASFQQTDLGGSGQISAQQVSAYVTNYGSCTITQTRTPSLTPVPVGPTPTPLDAGAAINVKGPAGTKQMTLQAPGSYSAQFASATTTSTGIPGLPPIVNGSPFLEAGSFAIDNAAGGADVGAFSLNVTNPKPMSWDNQDQITSVDRSQGVTVNWSGGDPASYVQILGSSSQQLASKVTVSVTFVCSERVSAGTFSVPSYVTSALPPSAANSGGGILGLYSVSTQPVTIPGVDIGTFSSLSAAAKNIAFQ
jgi:hypothetical protein